MSEPTTDFGFEKVPLKDKQKKVNEVFTSVAHNYDLMNDLMSGGLHRIWKRQAILMMQLKPNHTVLDLAGGTGDLTMLMAKKLRPPKQIVLSDINYDMLDVGRTRLIDKGITSVDALNFDAQHLPFPDESFDRMIIGFGLRNVPEKDKALKEMYRCLKPGGMLCILEFSQVKDPLKPLYDLYSFKVLPKLGSIFAKDSDSYQYLAESIRKHPNQEQLKELVLEQGFNRCEYFNLTLGIVALHRAYKDVT